MNHFLHITWYVLIIASIYDANGNDARALFFFGVSVVCFGLSLFEKNRGFRDSRDL